VTARRTEEVVRALIRRPAVQVAPEATLRVVAEILGEELIGAVVVRAPHAAGPGTRASGLVSERDVVQAIASGADPDRTSAESVMTSSLALAHPDEPVLTAARRMLENEIRHLPVVEDDTVIGVISARDVLEALVDEIGTTSTA
jgi:CBS domain-containing protein